MEQVDTQPEEQEQEPASEFPKETWLTDENWVDDINVRWRKVIDDLMNGSTILQAYAHAYDIETSLPKDYNVAAACGSRLLKNAKFRELWHKVIEERGFSNEVADWQLVDLMTNPKYEATVRRAAIHDYNELTGRIIKKVDTTSGGKPIQQPVVMPLIEPRHDAVASDQAEAAASS